MEYNSGGCKITIKNKTSKEQILDSLAYLLTRLEEEQGIEEFSNINIYFQMYKNDEKQVLVRRSGLSKIVGFDLSEKTPNPKKIITKLSDDSKTITYDKEVDFKKIKETIDNTIKLYADKSEKNEIISLPINLYESELAKQKAQEAAEIRKIQEQRAAIAEQRELKEQEEKNRLTAFKQMICQKLNIEYSALSEITTSVGYIKEEKTMLRYITQKQLPREKGEGVFRITFKEKTTKLATHIEIYSLKFDLITQVPYTP